MEKQVSSNLQKYQSTNPVRRFLLSRFIEKMGKIFRKINPAVILDAGCGEGIMIEKLNRSYKSYKTYKSVDFYGIDVSKTAIEEAKKRVPFAKLQTGSIYSLPYQDNFFDLVICSEVLEHLENPEKALLELKRLSKKYLLLSVPNEPFFRISSLLSGKYLRTWGNHPEHLQNWNQIAFKKMVEKHLKILKVESSFPWTIVLAMKKVNSSINQ